MKIVCELWFEKIENGMLVDSYYSNDINYTGRWKIVEIENKEPELLVEIEQEKDVSKWYQCERMKKFTYWISEDSFRLTEIPDVVEHINVCTSNS